MKLNVSEWKEFIVGKVFDCNTTILSIKDVLENGSIPFISRTAENNGCDGYVMVEKEAITKGQCLTIGAEGIYCFYQPKDFATGNKVYTLRNNELNFYQYIFVATILNKEDYKYSYGRARIKSKLENEVIKLPIQYNSDGSPLLDNTYKYSEQGYIPDWQFMEDYIKSLHYKPLTTKRVNEKKIELNVSQWEEFYVGDVFKIKYGINMELNACEECDMNDSESVAFVARTAENNGVSAYVKKEKDKVPQKAGTITCAGGGSVLSTFVQFHDFYSGRDLYLLNEKEALSIKTKLFLTTIILKNQYKYSYGRQANKTLPSLVLKLPIQRNSDGSPVIDETKKYHSKGYIPDWQFMEDYINSLPYSDRIV